ncbi:triose-phosphate isomerase [Reichenbachiella ulvae]|uniref:Triosephosphate isomerase n=1 Tax=Reichenbachiella ulvae TaxID=2980104 RepID=A0ABT3CXF3_9BACT|nr:triose-phosphate isomerase [Reichenbachiella ulvae]MCV9388385.1 triose-phosphate isomerase [Reichenbachiella ulvae]
MRQKIVAGNWKMNNDLEAGKKLALEVLEKSTGSEKAQIVLGTPYIHLTAVAADVAGKNGIEIAAQNCSDKASGAYTGEISASMVKSTGANYVILGHSERREYFSESNELLAAKVDIALENGLTPIFCCGEPLEIREAGTMYEFVKEQLTESLFHLSAEDFAKITIAYEPIWAIGTGKTASSEQAQEMHKELRDHLASKFGQEAADACPILYGGSCKPGNAKELFSQADVDGGLIGGASLNADDFLAIVNAF